jgi:hypothetical protein
MAAKLENNGLAEYKEKLLPVKVDHDYSHIGICLNEEQVETSMMMKCWKTMEGIANKACQMGRSDPRKIIFAAKMGLALTIISLLIFLKEPFNKDIGRNSVWAILTVVVVFEFSIGTYVIIFFIYYAIVIFTFFFSTYKIEISYFS